MLNRNKSTIFYLLLVVVASVMVGMVLASRLDLAPQSSAQTLNLPPVNSAPITGPLTATTFREVAKNVTPAVVNIRADSMQPQQADLNDFFGGGGGGSDDFFDRFFGGGGSGPQQRSPRGENQQQPRRQQPRDELVSARGTGFIIDKSGLILTNNHVVEGATKILVSLYGEDEDHQYPARVIGRDQLTDSALIELTEKPNHELPIAKLGDSSQMQPGDWVMAIGNPFGLAHSVSVGVISANRPGGLPVADRRNADVLQTDAAINPGNSGGPLINLRGEVIGVNTAIATTGFSQGNMGVGYAIPSNTIREVLPQLRSGKIVRGRIGVVVQQIQRSQLDALGLKNRTGALVRSVEDDSPAEKAGLEPGDVILQWNGTPVANNDELVSKVTKTKPGTTVPLRVLRDKQEKTLNVTVEELNLDSEGSNRRDRTSGSVEQSETPKGFGMTIDDVTPDWARRLRLNDGQRGAVVTDVDQGSPAWEAGLRPGHVIVRVGSTRVASAADAQRELNRVTSGGTATLRAIENGQEVFMTVTKR